MLDQVKEQIWRDFGPFLYADPFKILHIIGFALTVSTALLQYQLPLFSPHVFD